MIGYLLISFLVSQSPIWTIPEYKRAVSLAVDHVNNNPGSMVKPGQYIELIIGDDGCEFPPIGVSNALDMILEDKVLAIFGPTCSVASIAVSLVAQYYQVTHFKS